MGKMGKIRAREIKSCPYTELRAVSDVNPKMLSEYEVPAFSQPQEILNQDLDALFVCTYNSAAPDLIVGALERGLHVFCEKPPGRCVADVLRIREAHEKHPDCKVKFGFNHRYHYSVIEAKSMIDSGLFGRILWLRGVYGKAGGVEFESNWRSDKTQAGGGILLDQGIHMLDLFRYFAGDFDEIKSMISTSYWNIPVEDNAFAVMRNSKGQIASIHSSSTQWKHRFSLEIALQEGYINLNGILSSTRSYGEETLTVAKKQFEDTASAFGKPREEMIYFDRDDSWRLEVEEFIAAIRGEKRVEHGTIEDALAVMRLVEEIYRNSGR